MSRRVSRIGDAVASPYQVTLAAIVAFCLLLALAPAAGATAADANSGPTANATASSSTVGVVETVTLDASDSTDSDGSIESYEWDVDGDGDIEATDATIGYSYDSPGTYDATVTVTDADGNTDSATVTVTVRTEPDYLESNDWKYGGPEIEEYANYDNLTLHNKNDEDWFEVTPNRDGTLSVDLDYDHHRCDGNVELYIRESDDLDVLAQSLSEADDEYVSTDVREGETYVVEVQFDPCEYRGPSGDIVDSGDNYWSKYDIEISAPNSAPSADATASSSTVGLTEPVTLDARGSSDPGGAIESYEWDVDGDGDVEADGLTPEVSYDSLGTYDATVTVTDRRGKTDSATVTVTVDDGLDANATASSSAVGVGETVTLDASGSTNTAGAIESYEWDIDGDGEVEADGPTNEVSYDSPGTYDATVTVTDDNGDTDSATVTVTVDDGPAASVTASPSSVTVGETVTLDASGSSDPDGAIESYEWDIDGHGDAAGPTHEVSYDSAGRYDATVTVTDRRGKTDSATVTVTVKQPSNSAPTANATATVSKATVGQSIWLDASNSTDPDGTIESYEWDIDGDGDVEATGPNPEVSYDSLGTYDATVTVTDDGLATDTAAVTIKVGRESQTLEPNNEWSSATDIDGSIAIDGLSISGPQDRDYYAVDLDEGETVTASIEFDHSDGNLDLLVTDSDEPQRYGIPHENSDSGTDDETVSYTVDSDELEYTDDGSGTHYVLVYGDGAFAGGGDTNSYNLSITTSGDESGGPGNSAPTASATANSSDLTAGETVTFDASGSTDADGSIESYEWDVDGDGKIDTNGATINHSYAGGGGFGANYDATVYVTDDDGATASATVTVYVTDWPTASATANESTVYVGETVTLNASGTINPDGSIATYGWHFDDDYEYEALGETPEVSFDSPGTYDVELQATDENRLVGKDTVTITVEEAPNNGPTATATANASTITVTEAVRLEASASTDPDRSIERYEWDVDGDGYPEAIGATTNYSYDSADTYDTTVTVTDNEGGTDNATVTVTVEESQGQSQSMVDAIDANDDGKINDQELLTAVDHWQHDEAVPGTGGQTVDDQTLLDLVERWQEGS